MQSLKLAPNEQAFVPLEPAPNRKGQPLLVEWQVASRAGASPVLEPFMPFVQRAGIKAGGMPNRGKQPIRPVFSPYAASIAAGCGRHARLHGAAPKAFAAQLHQRLEGTLARCNARKAPKCSSLS